MSGVALFSALLPRDLEIKVHRASDWIEIPALALSLNQVLHAQGVLRFEPALEQVLMGVIRALLVGHTADSSFAIPGLVHCNNVLALTVSSFANSGRAREEVKLVRGSIQRSQLYRA